MCEMKDSGIEWLGKVPVDWKFTKISNLYDLRNTKVSDRDYPPLSVTMNGVVPQLDTAAKTDAHDSRKLVKKGDFTINSRSDRRGSCGISSYTGSVSSINTVMKPVTIMDSGYYGWLFKCSQFSDEFYKWGHGIVADLWTTNWQDMKNIIIPYPPSNKQKLISNFLDKKCSEIDSLLKNIQQQISNLEEYKKTIITEVVTKGLDSDVNMKDSGIEWIGEIPCKWNVSKLNYECYIRARLGWKGLKADEYVNEGYVFLSAFNIQNNKMDWEKVNFINKKRYDESPEIKLSVGDVLLVKDGAGIGKTARIDDLPLGESTTNSSLAVITPLYKLHYKYLSYYLQCSIFSNFINRVLNGMGVPHLTQEIMKSIYVVLPDISTQKEIAKYLDKKCSEIDLIIESKKQQLLKLEEYKKSLIYECVTGKKEIL